MNLYYILEVIFYASEKGRSRSFKEGVGGLQRERRVEKDLLSPPSIKRLNLHQRNIQGLRYRWEIPNTLGLILRTGQVNEDKPSI